MLWVCEKRSLSKLIQKNVFLLNPCSKRKYVTHSYMDTRNWSLLLKRITYSLTFFFYLFRALRKLAMPTDSRLIFDKKPRGRSLTYRPDLWWYSLRRNEVCKGSCWRLHWPPGSRSCTACALAGCGQPRGAGSGPGGAARYPRCRRTASTFPAQADTSCRWHCRRCRRGRPSRVARSTPARARFRSRWRWRCVVRREQLQVEGKAWMRWGKWVWNWSWI